MPSGDMYITEGATITFTKSGGTIIWSPDGVIQGLGRVSPPTVLTSDGDAVGPGMYRWGFKWRSHTTNPVIGREIRLYLGYSDGVNDFNISQTDAVVNPESQTMGSHYLGSVVCNEALTTKIFTAFGFVFIPVKQTQVIMFNDSGVTTRAVNNTTAFYLTPLSYKKVA